LEQDAFVSIRNLTKRFGEHVAVNDISLNVAEGHTLALLGPSGCGKTTILRCLAGLETPDSGHISLAGNVVFDHNARVNLMPEQRELGIVFQSYAVWPHMSVSENVGFPLKVRGVAKAEYDDRVARILDIVGLGAWRDKGATQLSGGQQQRVALARALVHQPRLVLFDEPMSNLDTQLRDQVRMELNILQAKLGFTAIYVTHDQAEAFSLAETVVVMNLGRIETSGPPRDVFHRPRTPFVARFLGLNVCEGKLVQANATAGGQVEVAFGESLRLRGLSGDEQKLTAGAPVLVCVRKEHIGIRKLAPGAIPQGLSGEIRAASFLGLNEEYVVALEGVELRAVQPASGLKAGDRVEVSIRPEDCIVFLGSENRLD
jgi:iron(III) transport system ATP-binding protein